MANNDPHQDRTSYWVFDGDQLYPTDLVRQGLWDSIDERSRQFSLKLAKKMYERRNETAARNEKDGISRKETFKMIYDTVGLVLPKIGIDPQTLLI